MMQDTRAWEKALAAAPDEHEVHTIFRRRLAGPVGRQVARQEVVGRRIVAGGVVLYEEIDGSQPLPAA